MSKNNKLTVLDLFCGCGGLSLGFEQSGKFNIVAGVDNYKDALKTFELNHSNSKGLNIDLFDPNFTDEIKKKINNQKIDVIIGGPPCQGFSVTGPRKFNDKRNTLYLAMIKSVKSFNPKAFLIENVPGLINMYGGKVKDEILKRFDSLGYCVKYKVLIAADYGVPQLRKRAFFVGIKKGFGEFSFPVPKFSKNNYLTTYEAISDLPSREKNKGDEVDKYQNQPKNNYQIEMREGSKNLHNHVASEHSEYVKGVISQVPDGGNYKDLPSGVGESRKFHVAWTRYGSNKPSGTIDTGHRNHFHYKYNRIPTVRENARLQSFPDKFIINGSRTSQYRQIGNAVPPKLAQSVAENIYQVIKDEK